MELSSWHSCIREKGSGREVLLNVDYLKTPVNQAVDLESVYGMLGVTFILPMPSLWRNLSYRCVELRSIICPHNVVFCESTRIQ